MDFRHFHNTIHIQAHKYLLYNTHTHKHVFKRRVWWAGGWCDLAWITNPVQSNPIQSKRRGWWAGGWCDLAWITIQSSPIQSNPIQTQGLVGWWMVRSGLDEPTDEWQAPRVSPYRLAAHLVSAFTIFATLVWTTMDLR